MPRDGMVRLLSQPFLEDPHRLVQLAERAVRQREQPSRLGVPRPEGDHLGEADGRLVRTLLAVQQDAQVVVGVRVLGMEADRGSIRRLCFLESALRAQHHTEVVVGIGMTRIECDRALVRRRCSLQLESILQDDPEVAVPVCPRPARARDSARSVRLPAAPALLMGEHSREMQRVSIVRRDVENAAVHVRGSRPLLVLLQQDGDRYRFVHAQGATPSNCSIPCHGLACATARSPPLLRFLVGLDVVLEMDARIERSIGLLRPVLEVDLGERQAHVLRAALVTVALCHA